MSDFEIKPTSLSISGGQTMVMQMHTTTFFNADGEVYLTISPDGFSDGKTTVDIGDAGALFATWIRRQCNVPGVPTHDAE